MLFITTTMFALAIAEAFDAAEAAAKDRDTSQETTASSQPVKAQATAPAVAAVETPALQDTHQATPQKTDSADEAMDPACQRGPKGQVAVASGWVVYDHGRQVLLQGQVVPFCDVGRTVFDAGLAHVVSLAKTEGETPLPLNRQGGAMAETSTNWADGIFGFSGSRYATRQGLFAAESMDWAGWGSDCTSLFPTFWLSARDQAGDHPVTMINPTTGESGEYVRIPDSHLQPFCGVMSHTLSPESATAMMTAIISSYGLCKIHISSRFGFTPRVNGPVVQARADYEKWIQKPRSLTETVNNRDRFGLWSPTYKIQGQWLSLADRGWITMFRRLLEDNDPMWMRSRLRSYSGLL